MNIYWNDYKDDGLMVIEANISLDDKLSDFLDYCAQYDVQYPALMNDKGGLEIPEKFGSNYANNKWLVFPDGTYMLSPQKGDILRSLNMDDVTAPSLTLKEPKAQDVFIDNAPVKISWIGSDENELYRFEVFFSEDDGENYKKIVMIPGTSFSYTWSSPSVNSERCRIKVVAIDVGQNETEKVSGRFTIINNTVSKNNKVLIKNKKAQLRINGQTVTTDYSKNINVEIYSANGKLCYSENLENVNHNRTVEVPLLSKGLYFVKLDDGLRVNSHQIVIK